MSISFEDSLNKAKAVEASGIPATIKASIATVEAYSVDEGWEAVVDKGYDFYDEYSDDNISTINEKKFITLNVNQVNITQETNSQYIPFQMPRYFDGFDLSTAKLQVYFVNNQNAYGIDYPVNVYRSTDKIKFAWLVDSNVTMVAGIVRFEIQAVGENSHGETYIWKTRPNGEMNIIESLTGSKFIEPDETWQTDFLSKVTAQVGLAQEAAADAQKYAETAQIAAASIESAVKEEIETQVDSIVESKVDEMLEASGDKLIENHNTDANSHADIRKLVSEKASQDDIPTKTSQLTNDSGFITNAVSDLVNYYAKAETYTRNEVIALVSAIPKFTISVVSALPTSNISATTIYLISGGSGTDMYTEYIYVDGSWEILGSQRVDLSGYATESWVTNSLAAYAKTDDIPVVPTSLKNPYKLKVTGATTGEYDGSAEITIDIPTVSGENGKDGVSVTHSWSGTTLTVTSASGTSSADLKGDQGEKGDKGDKGDTGSVGATGAAGADGYTPVRGTDYWTDEDKAEIKAYVDEAILGGAW